MYKNKLAKLSFVAICGISVLSVPYAQAQMFTEIETPSEQLYEITYPSNKVLGSIKNNLKELISIRLKSPEVGVGKDEMSYFKADIQKIYSEMDENVHLFWKRNKKDITATYSNQLTPEELIVYYNYLATPESSSIEKKRPKINQEINKLLQKWIEKSLDKKMRRLTNKIIQHQLEIE